MRNERQADMRRFPSSEPVANISVSGSTSLSLGTLNENLASEGPHTLSLLPQESFKKPLSTLC